MSKTRHPFLLVEMFSGFPQLPTRVPLAVRNLTVITF